MKHTISCDDVFEILTRAPFPTGDPSDQDVEMHLSVCHECRRLAEALRPALELMHESVSPDEVNDLPGYFGELAINDRFASQPPWDKVRTPWQPRTMPKRRADRSAIGTFLACSVLGGLFGFIVFEFGSMPPKVERPPSPRMLATNPATRTRLSDLMTALHAPMECRTTLVSLASKPNLSQAMNGLNSAESASEVYQSVDAESDAVAKACCTYCHATNRASRPKVEMVKLTVACEVCHRPQIQHLPDSDGV